MTNSFFKTILAGILRGICTVQGHFNQKLSNGVGVGVLTSFEPHAAPFLPYQLTCINKNCFQQ